MKKVFVIVLAIVMALGCISSYAYNGDIADFGVDPSFVGMSYNADTPPTGAVRNDGTNSRGLPDEDAVFVNVGTDDAINLAVKVTGSAYLSGDNLAADYMQPYTGITDPNFNLVATVDLKLVSDAKFCGVVIDSTENGDWGSTNTDVPLRADNKYILNSGYGFSLRSGNVIDIFINASSTGSVDNAEISLDDFGIDASDFNTYTVYRTTDAKAYFTVNNILVSVVDLSTGFIYDAAAENVLAEGNGDKYNVNGAPFFCIVGDGSTEIYFDNISQEAFETLPEFDKYAATADVSLLQGIGGVGTWLNGAAGSYVAVAVNTLSDFYGFSIPVVWTSNPNNAGQGSIEMKFEVFAFDETIEGSIGGTALYSATKTYDMDLGAGDSFTFDSALGAGKYVIKITQVTGNGDGDLTRYFVLPSAGAELAFDPFYTIYSGDKFNVILKLAKTDDEKYLDKVSAIGSIFATGSSDEDGGNAHQLTGHGPLAILTEIPEGIGISALSGHCPTWGDSGSGIVAQAFAWTGDYDSSIAGDVVATASISDYSEAAQWASLTFDNVIPEGQYIILFTAGNEHHVGFWNALSRSDAISGVFKNGTETADYTPVIKINYVVNEVAPVTDEPTTEEPTTDEPVTEEPTTDEPTTDEPATEAPKTGDAVVALFAVVAVVALAAVVVFKKRVND